MRHIFDYLDKLKDDLRHKQILLFLDYDGTLSPIAKTPTQAVLPAETKDALWRLAKKLKSKMTIISGRSLKDIKNILGIKGIIYVGNHGLEIEGPKIKFEGLVSAQIKKIIKILLEKIRLKLGSIDGVMIEDKSLTLSIHYRLAQEKDLPFITKTIEELSAPHLLRKRIKVNHGKKVIEIKPQVDWDKGKAVLWLMARECLILEDTRILPIYIGDDVTDEDAFRALKNKGITIFVGAPKPSEAKYYLKDTEEVLKFLKELDSLFQ